MYIDYKTSSGKNHDFSLNALTQIEVIIILHALELYQVTQEEFIKSWSFDLKKNLGELTAKTMNELCFNQETFVSGCIEKCSSMVRTIRKENIDKPRP